MEHDQLIERIKDVALLRGTFTLRSGRTSKYYLDKYLFETQPDVLAEIGKRFAAMLPEGTDRVAGAELGGIPLVTAVSLASGLPSILVRQQRKGYGTAKQIEGVLNPGEQVVMVEDVVTTAGQAVEALGVLEQAGAQVKKLLVVIDREEGGREKVEALNVAFEPLITRTQLGIEE